MRTDGKYSNTKFHKNPSSGSRIVPCEQTDRQDEANSQFRNFANAPKKIGKVRTAYHLWHFRSPIVPQFVTTFKKKNTDDVSIINERNEDRIRINEWKRQQSTKLMRERKPKSKDTK